MPSFGGSLACWQIAGIHSTQPMMRSESIIPAGASTLWEIKHLSSPSNACQPRIIFSPNCLPLIISAQPLIGFNAEWALGWNWRRKMNYCCLAKLSCPGLGLPQIRPFPVLLLCLCISFLSHKFQMAHLFPTFSPIAIWMDNQFGPFPLVPRVCAPLSNMCPQQSPFPVIGQ